jgi:hypothetical protein
VQLVVASVLDGRGEEIEAIRRGAVKVVEHTAALQVGANVVGHVFPHRFKQGMTRRDPFQSRVFREERFVEND